MHGGTKLQRHELSNENLRSRLGIPPYELLGREVLQAPKTIQDIATAFGCPL